MVLAEQWSQQWAVVTAVGSGHSSGQWSQSSGHRAVGSVHGAASELAAVVFSGGSRGGGRGDHPSPPP